MPKIQCPYVQYKSLTAIAWGVNARLPENVLERLNLIVTHQRESIDKHQYTRPQHVTAFETCAKRLGNNVLTRNNQELPARKSSVRDKISILTGDFTGADYSLRFSFFFFYDVYHREKPPAVIGEYFRCFTKRATEQRRIDPLSKLRISRTKTDFLRRLKISFVIPETPLRIVHSARHFFL